MNTQNYQQDRRQLAVALMDVGAVLTRESDHPLVVERDGPQGRERGFRLKLHEQHPQAPLSPFFLNLRTPDNPKPGPLSPAIVALAGSCMYTLAIGQELHYNAVVGVPRAGDPFAEAFSKVAFQTPLLKMAKDDGKDGSSRHIASLETACSPGTTVLVIDDLITKAESKLEAVGVLESLELFVRDVLVLIDREQGGRAELEMQGFKLASVFTVTELLALYTETGKMNRTLADEIRAYLAIS